MRIATLLVASVAPSCLASSPTDQARPKNVVFILADDLGYMDIGANNPNCFYDTPNIDRLAESGTRLISAYAACPVCSPTRASILTGKHPVRVGITDYINPAGGNQPEQWKRNTRLLPAPFALELALSEQTLAEQLREEGYATFFAGKWHLGSEGHYPEDQGFDVNRGGIECGGPYGGDKYFSPYGNARLEDGPKGEHLPARLAAETASFIADQRAGPFFAMLSFYSVHTPLIGRPDLVEKYEERRAALPQTEPDWRPEGARKTRLVQDHAVYAAMVEALDSAVGVVLDELERLDLARDTIVVFFSDNGGLSTSEGHPTSNEPLRAGKGWLYEGGIREPCIVRVPGRRNGEVSDAAIMSVDFVPTLLELLGLPVPNCIDGVSFAPLFTREPSSPRKDMFWHYPHYGNQGGSPSGAVRAGDYKLIEFFETGRLELYDIARDPSETRNLASSHAEIARDLHRRLGQWRSRNKVRMPTVNVASREE